ncbi:MAG: hypothetical protein ACLQU5_00070 [Isosphaeraceae bacterium]
MNRRDWNLVVLSAANGNPLSPVQLQKSLFLLQRTLPTSVIGEDFYVFEPYNYGPFDPKVYDDAMTLASMGLASRSESAGRWTEYSATAEGLREGSELAKTLHVDVRNYIRNLVEWVRSQPFASLVRTIYRHYPDMKANSIFRD